MSDTFANELSNFEEWRLNNLQQLKALDQWLQDCNLVNDQVANLLTDMRSRLQSQQLKVAFVAEFSRGKSELINAIFFASGGRRIMPASVGRTTMCPVEIGYDPNLPPCIRLLPLETRRHNISLAEWRYAHDEAWIQELLDIEDMDKLAESMVKVSERSYVTPKEALELGLWDEENPDNNPSTNALGLVEIPKWRHAIVNYPHPLLKRGISILDTPGLNTVGVEPELTLDLLPQAHAVLFILGADTGVTRSDLQIWRDYLSGASSTERPCYVLLNKIDVLWDGLLSTEQAQQQLQQQRESCAALLNIPLSRILAVSAQKGLLGKIKNDFQLLQDSKLLMVERLFVRELLPKRQEILQQVLVSGIAEMDAHVKERLSNQQQTLDSQIEELQGLDGKNTGITEQISARIGGQKDALESLRKKASGMRIAEKKMLRLLQKRMDHAAIDRDMVDMSLAVQDQGLRLSFSKVFTTVMERLRDRVQRCEKIASQFETLLRFDMKELEKEYGIKLTIQPCPGIGNLMSDIDMVQKRHEVFFGVNQSLRLRRASYAEQLFKTLLTRVRSIFDEAFEMLDMWSNNSYSILVVQVNDLEDAIKNLYDGIQRIHSAKESLNERIDEMQAQRMRLWEQQEEFDAYIRRFDQASLQYLFQKGAPKIVPPLAQKMHEPIHLAFESNALQAASSDTAANHLPEESSSPIPITEQAQELCAQEGEVWDGNGLEDEFDDLADECGATDNQVVINITESTVSEPLDNVTHEEIEAWENDGLESEVDDGLVDGNGPADHDDVICTKENTLAEASTHTADMEAVGCEANALEGELENTPSNADNGELDAILEEISSGFTDNEISTVLLESFVEDSSEGMLEAVLEEAQPDQKLQSVEEGAPALTGAQMDDVVDNTKEVTPSEVDTKSAL